MKSINRCFISAALFIVILVSSMYSQNTTLQLPTAYDTISSFRILNSTWNVQMLVNSDGGLYMGGSHSYGAYPSVVSATRMMWYPKKSAFRAGSASSQWDDTNIGDYSVAFGAYSVAKGIGSTAAGVYTTASGNYSTAIGFTSMASGVYSVALGNSPTASGVNSVALGTSSVAGGDYSTAVGYNSVASGIYSTVMGFVNEASGHSSTAMGYLTIAGGTHSTATGNTTAANGDYSTAMGNYVKANHEGSFIIGDRSKVTPDSSSAIHQMTMRFAGGYRLYTSRECTTGVTMSAGGGSWASVSDSTRKTNFMKSDGEYFLSSLSKLRLGSWNYKGQNPVSFRHYGPMAQEIFHYFGKDEYGTIGDETTLASADMDGIIMICLQALEKRTRELQLANEKIVSVERQNCEQKAINDRLTERIERLESRMASTVSKKTDEIISSK